MSALPIDFSHESCEDDRELQQVWCTARTTVAVGRTSRTSARRLFLDAERSGP